MLVIGDNISSDLVIWSNYQIIRCDYQIGDNISSDLVIWDPAASKTLGKDEQLSK